jgi:hypothetical protein
MAPVLLYGGEVGAINIIRKKPQGTPSFDHVQGRAIH